MLVHVGQLLWRSLSGALKLMCHMIAGEFLGAVSLVISAGCVTCLWVSLCDVGGYLGWVYQMLVGEFLRYNFTVG